MNIGVIIAGGIGARMNAPTPKQFIVVRERPIIVYTLEEFNKNEQIDAILVVCLKGWEDILWKYAKKYKLNKLKWVIAGGDTGMESLRNSMEFLKANCDPNDILIIHDAVRPLVSDDIINANIAGVTEFGTAITCVPCTEALLHSDDGETSTRVIDRNLIHRTQTPQSLRLSKFIWAHEEAQKRDINDTVATCTLLVELGESVHFVLGQGTNFKITTSEDIDLLDAFLHAKKKKEGQV
jgi:2-C-methyl-D-erythritol 4-phosphate cytidylyltransferase